MQLRRRDSQVAKEDAAMPITYVCLADLKSGSDGAEGSPGARAEGPDALPTLKDAVKSIPIWVWGLLKSGPHTPRELRDILRCNRWAVYQAVSQLRQRGQKITLQRGSYHLAEDTPPLSVLQTSAGLVLAPRTPENAHSLDAIDLW